MTHRAPRSHGLSRRQTLAGAAAAGVGAPLLAACGSSDQSSGGGSAADSPTHSGGATASGGSGGGSGGDLSTTDVPEGSGVILADQKVVVTQPAAGEFKAFSAVCTHAGCIVATVTDTINCNCHGSRFSITDGSVVAPPATQPLPEAGITVDGDTITVS